MTSFVVDQPHLHPSSSSQGRTAGGYDARHPQPRVPVPTSSSAPATTASTAATLYVVQKCWLDGPRYAQPIDCGRLWTSTDAATQFAHASANHYTSIVQLKKLNNSGRIATSSPTVRTLLLDNHQYGFATSGRLFWVRAVQVPLCPCYSSENPTMTALTATTALARLHHGVVGGTEAGAGRRGTEDVVDCARIDCPKNCLQHWISTQLRSHQACSWLRLPVGNAQRSNNSKNGSNSQDDWWKEEWSDWETWGGSSEATSGSAPHANAVASTMGVSSSHHKRRCSWSDHGAMEDDDDDVLDEEEDAAMLMDGPSSPSNRGTRGRLVTEDHHPHHHYYHNHHHPQSQNAANTGWFAPPEVVDYAPNKRAVLGGSSTSSVSAMTTTSTTGTNSAVDANALGRDLVDSEMVRG